jgi:signal transduction histidine kinase
MHQHRDTRWGKRWTRRGGAGATADAPSIARDPLVELRRPGAAVIALAALAVAVSAPACVWLSTGGSSAPLVLAALATGVSVAALWAGRRGVRLARASARLELLEAQGRAGALTQLVVHDLRNPLATVIANIGFALETAEREPGLGEVVEDLRIARGEAERLSGMIGDLLLVSRLERGELACRLAEVRIGELLEPVARATRPRARARGISIDVELPEGLAARVDAPLLRRLVENLVSSALRSTRLHGRIRLCAGVEGDRLLLAVRSTGPGVPAATRPRLFAKCATEPGAEPHDRGLYLCRLVAEAHGGVIALVEREGWGTSFEARLPLAAASHPAGAVAVRPGGPVGY